MILPIDTETASKQTTQLFDTKTSSTPRLFSDAASCSSRLEILPYWSSLDLFVLVEILFPKEALLKSNQTHFYSSFILVFSLNERVGNGVIFIMSSC